MKLHFGSFAIGAVAGFVAASALGFLAVRATASNMRASYRTIIESAHLTRQAGVAEDEVWRSLKESTRDP